MKRDLKSTNKTRMWQSKLTKMIMTAMSHPEYRFASLKIRATTSTIISSTQWIQCSAAIANCGNFEQIKTSTTENELHSVLQAITVIIQAQTRPREKARSINVM